MLPVEVEALVSWIETFGLVGVVLRVNHESISRKTRSEETSIPVAPERTTPHGASLLCELFQLELKHGCGVLDLVWEI
jgi:hypothetical protein